MGVLCKNGYEFLGSVKEGSFVTSRRALNFLNCSPLWTLS